MEQPNKSSSHPSTPVSQKGHHSPPPRSSMEDEGYSSVTRKRPRLDSGERAHQNITSPFFAIPGETGRADSSDRATVIASPTSSVLPDPDTLGHQDPAEASMRAASKVTLNLRDTVPAQISPQRLSSPKMDADGTPETRHSSSKTDTMQRHSPAPLRNPGESVVSSRGDSPDFEVAEPEDMDALGGDTVWKSSLEHELLARQREHLDMFPLCDNNSMRLDREREIQDSIKTAIVSKTGGVLASLLERTATWIRQYLHRTQQAPQCWPILLSHESAFWHSLSGLPRFLLDESLYSFTHANPDLTSGSASLDGLLSAFIALTARMVASDGATLKNTKPGQRSSDIKLISAAYCYNLRRVLAPRSEVLTWAKLNSFGIDSTSQITSFACGKDSQRSLLCELANILSPLLTHSCLDPEQSKLLQRFIVFPTEVFCLYQANYHTQATHEGERVRRSFQEFFETVDMALRSAIKKQSSPLTNEAFSIIYQQLSQLVGKSRPIACGLLSRFNLESKDDIQALSVPEQKSLAEAMWKIDLCEKCVREGRMEIRIAGLDSLQNCLIDVYRQFIGVKQAYEPHHIIVELLSDHLLENRVIEYLLSVDSHPQIISRSANVVGFLAVSGRWTEEQTNSIWHSIQRMEDLRASETIIDMLPQVTKYLSRPELEHFIQRMLDTPISRFDPKTLNLLLIVVGQLLEQNSEHEEDLTVAISAFASLLRKASGDPTLNLSRKNEVWCVVQSGFQNLATIEWPRRSRWSIYQDCFGDLTMQSMGTSGSCAIIRRLLERYGVHDLAQLAEECDAVELILKDFSRLGEIREATGTDFDVFMPPVEDRLRILELMIYHLPGLITDQFTGKLWESMFAEHMGSRAREAAWEFLARIATNSKTTNVFLDQCIRDHIPSLDPTLYSRSTLSFANCICEYERRVSQRLASEGNAAPLSITSVDLFWRLASGAEDDQVSNRASQSLVERVQELSKMDSGFEQELMYIDKSIIQVIETGNKLLQIPAEHNDTNHIATCRRGFMRAYNMLSQFLGAAKHHSPGSPSNRSDSQTSQSSLAGERKVQIQYTTSDRGISSSPKSIGISNHTKLEELIERLQSRTKFSKFNVICGGQRLDLKDQGASSVEALGLHQKGMLILHRIPGSELLNTMTTPRKALRSVNDVVLRRFNELYLLLKADPLVADRVLTFLRAFEPHPDVVELVCNEENAQRYDLPLNVPHQAVYSLHAILSTQQAQLQDGTIDHGYMQRSLRIMTKALFALDLPLSPNQLLRPYWLPTEILRCILLFLKEPVPVAISRAYFPDAAALVTKLYEITAVDDKALDPESFILLQSCFAVLLETSRFNESAWKSFSTSKHGRVLFQRLILANPDPNGRNLARQTVVSVLTALSGSEGTLIALDKDQAPSNADGVLKDSVIRLFWQITCTVIPSATGEMASRSQQFFSLALSLFRAMDDEALHVAELRSNMKAWIGLLQNYKPQYVVTHDVTEWPVKGLSDLIHEAMLVLNRHGASFELEPQFFAQLFGSIMFPEVLESDERQSTEINAPVLGSQTRGAVYRIILRAAIDRGDFLEPFSILNHVVNDKHSQMTPPTWNFDRTKHLRAPAGYPGLENLSNTCYLNSLLTQLFMNPRFREFILSCEIVDERSQALLLALQHLFASLQDGWQKAVNTKEVADAIETYDGPLDPTQQMDADEAFNLLFDRLESQLPNTDNKNTFKKLYGGQLIQQIKSKECDHVSERFEPVTAIQCDIQGKRNLLQSLQAYIEGETMEGDNKYKCSKCDRYVNAVKRACLKDVPDNLIFHLKRFDFDLMTGMRNKVNDHFSFPEMIDMAPYTVDYLEGKTDPADPDHFVLVGVLVHNGTAELGHYYSYIRERPGNVQSWVEFNDADVTQFDITSLAEQCFGGQSENCYPQTFPKSWNAYMLFYQRRSSIKADQEHFGRAPIPSPVKVSVNERLSTQMAIANESMARVFSLFGPEHANFVKDMLGAFTKARGPHCSADHEVEDAAINCAWAHLERVFGKELKRQGAYPALEFLSTVVATCAHCCNTAVDALVGGDGSRLRALFLRLPESELRIKVGNILLQALKNLKIHAPAVYITGNEHVDIDMDGESSQSLTRNGKFATVVTCFYGLLEVAPLNFRAWFEFYNFLAELACLGPEENMYMHRLGFLQHALKTLSIEPQHDWSSRYHDSHQHYIRLVEKRTYNLDGVMRLIVVLFEYLRKDEDDGIDDDAAVAMAPREYLTQEELNLLTTRLKPEGGDKRVPWILERAAAACDSRFAAKSLEDLTGLFVRNEALLRLESSVMDLISYGLIKNPAELAAPYLHVATAFVLTSDSSQFIEHIISLVADGTKTIGETGGAEHLSFFRRMLNAQNHVAYPAQPMQVILTALRLSPVWGLALLEYPDAEVTKSCAQLLRAALLDPTESHEQEDDITQAKLTAAAQFWTAIFNKVQKYVREHRALDEAKKFLLEFYELCLIHQVSSLDETEDADDIIAHYRALLVQATDLITLTDDVGSNGFESDELTDVSSTYGSPGIEEVS